MKNLAYTQKAQEMNIERFHIKGVRWFQKSFGNTYHTTYISALINGKWVEIGSTSKQYGYGEHFLCTAGEWLIQNGFVDAKAGYDFNSYSFREANSVDYETQDVKRQKDL